MLIQIHKRLVVITLNLLREVFPHGCADFQIAQTIHADFLLIHKALGVEASFTSILAACEECDGAPSLNIEVPLLNIAQIISRSVNVLTTPELYNHMKRIGVASTTHDTLSRCLLMEAVNRFYNHEAFHMIVVPQATRFGLVWYEASIIETA